MLMNLALPFREMVISRKNEGDRKYIESSKYCGQTTGSEGHHYEVDCVVLVATPTAVTCSDH